MSAREESRGTRDPSPISATVASARRRLVIVRTARSTLIAMIASLGVLLIASVVDAVAGIPISWRESVLPTAIVVAFVVVLAEWFRSIRPTLRSSDEAVALWFEARLPELRYSFVTSVEPRYAGKVEALERAVESAPLARELTVATRSALWRPALIVIASIMGLLLFPTGTVARVTSPSPGDALLRAGAASRSSADPLATIIVRVTAPAYAGMAVRAVDDPSTVAALVGSRIVVEGRGEGVRGVVAQDTLSATRAGDRWRVTLTVGSSAEALRLLGPARERVLVLDPIIDSVPSVQLESPSRDSVLRIATGSVMLRAALRDDHGLARAEFEYVVSSGAGETFTFRSGRIAATDFRAGTLSARLEGTFAIDSLRLGPGDLVHIRAVALDRNDVTGPGRGASETRTLRIARADEYDSVSVDPMPPTEAEKNALSQRMILLMTQELHAREPRIAVTALRAEARKIALEQTRLRKRVGEVIFIRLGDDNAGEHSHFAGDGHEHGAEGPINPDEILAAAERAANVDATRMLEGEGDETPVVAMNRPLLEAYNHMWRATTELETASPGSAIPWMERAIEALQRARAAERIYLKGRPPRVVVDLAKVRGTGKDKGMPDPRTPRAPADAERAERLGRFDRALGLIEADASAVADSLLLLRLTLPESEPNAASALDAAATALRRGGDVTTFLQLARRALTGTPVSRAGLSAWGR